MSRSDRRVSSRLMPCVSYDLFRSAFSTACGLLFITVKKARDQLSIVDFRLTIDGLAHP